MNEATLRVACGSPAAARRLQAALSVDDPESIETRVEDDVLEIRAASRTRMGLLRTLDDALGCLRAAEDATH